jgi:DNA-binding NarL/FixJ family response regulator/RecA/RadA recombinase
VVVQLSRLSPKAQESRFEPAEEAAAPLVGRMRECEQLERALDLVGLRSSGVIEVTGEPGIGKSSMLGELAARAARRGFAVLVGQASPGLRHVPFGVRIEAFNEQAAKPAAERLSQVLADGARWPGAVLPGPARPGGNGRPQDGQAGQYQIYREVQRLLEELAAPGLVVVLDDMHWADEQTVELLGHLVRRSARAPVLIALAYRPRQASAQLRAATVGAISGPAPVRLRLGPLSEREAEEFIASRGSPARRRALYSESGGNPFCLDALARAADRHLPASQAVPGIGELPPALEAALLAELDALSPMARQVAKAAAVSGAQFCADCVVSSADLAESAVLSAFRELASHDLIRLTSSQLFAFRHPVVQSVVYQSANPAWRIAAHRRAAAALERLGAPATARAYHIERSADHGDLEAIEVLEDAARAVCGQAPATAAGWLQAALRLLPDIAVARPRRVIIMLALAQALGAAGQLWNCREMLHEALRLRPGLEGRRRAEAVTLCAITDRLQDRRTEGHALLRAELSGLPDQNTVAAATLQFELACNELSDGDTAGCRRWAEQALAATRGRAERPLRASLHGVMAMAAALAGDVPAAAAQLRRAVPLLDGLLDGELTERLDLAVRVGWTELLLDRPSDALGHLDRALALAQSRGQYLALPDLLVVRVMALCAVGRLAEAAVHADEAMDFALTSGSDEQRAGALAMCGWAATWTGDLKVARSAGEKAVELRASGYITALATRVVAEACLAEGDAAGCLGLIGSLGGPDLPAAAASSRVRWYELLTRAAIAGGRLDAAADWAQRAIEAAAPLGLPGRTAIARLAHAQVLAILAPRDGYELAIAAGDSLSSVGLVLDAARARLVAGAAMAASGAADLAAEELAAAQSAFSACGAARLARQTMTERRRLAAHSRRRVGQEGYGGLAALTRREREIAALVGEGLTNRAIAQRLYVTEKTIEKHLSNVFAKLNVTSRSQVAVTVVRASGAVGDC